MVPPVPAVIQLTAGLFMWVLAPAILYVNFRAEANRAFAAFLVAQGGVLVTYAVGAMAGTVMTAGVWWSVHPYFTVAVPFALGYFISVYPHRRSWLPDGLPAWAPFLAGTLVFELVVLGHPERYWAVDPVPGVFSLSPGLVEGITWPAYRELGLMFWVGEITLLIGALVLTRDVVEGREGTPRIATAIVGMGLFAPVSCQCAGGEFLNRTLYNGWILLGTPHIQDPFSIGYAVGIVHELMILAIVGLFLVEYAYLAYHALTSKDDALRRILQPFLVLLTVSTGVLIWIFAPWFPANLRVPVWISLYGFWWLAGTALVSYGIARHSLFDLNIRLKWGIRRSTVAAVFVAAFFVAGELAETFFGEVFGPYAGVFAAGGLVFFLAPLEQIARRASDRAMPGTKPVSEMRPEECRKLFRDQAELVWMDGQLTEKDRAVLENLRERLGLDAETANTIESEVVGA